jgi:hypothetical protein
MTLSSGCGHRHGGEFRWLVWLQLHQRCALAGDAALRWRSGKHAALL